MTSPTAPGPAPPATGELRFAIVVTAAYALMLALTMPHHEMWRDELQAWMLARDSATIAELWANTRYEGHTGLWFLLLHALARATRSPVAMQVLHATVATATVLLIAWRAPLPRRWRALLPFGYFLAYDYAVISRPYALGVLLLLAWCAVRAAWPRRVVVQAVLLALLANTSVYGALLAAAAATAMLVPLAGRAGRATADWRPLAAAGVLLLAGAVAAAAWMVPPRQHVVAIVAPGLGDRDDPRVVHAGLAPLRSFVPIQAVGRYPRLWQSNALLHEGGLRRRAAGAAAGVALLVAGIALLRRRAEAAVLFGSFAAAYLAFSYLVYPGWLYHHGHLVVAFVGALWLARGVPPRAAPAVDALLLMQAAAAGLAIAADVDATFSGARHVASVLRATGRAEGVIVGASSGPASSVAGYLDRPVLAADRGRLATFVRWEHPLLVRSDEAEAAAVALARTALAATPERPITLLLADPSRLAHTGVTLVALDSVPARAVITGEAYHVYAVWPARPAYAAGRAATRVLTP